LSASPAGDRGALAPGRRRAIDRLRLADLPERLRDSADAVGTGELLWRRDDALAAVEWITGHGLGIIGGEVYARVGGAEASHVLDWLTDPPWKPLEPWPAYVERAAEQAAAQIAIARDDDAIELRFFLAVGGDGS
jgi:hypothetical protein